MFAFWQFNFYVTYLGMYIRCPNKEDCRKPLGKKICGKTDQAKSLEIIFKFVGWLLIIEGLIPIEKTNLLKHLLLL